MQIILTINAGMFRNEILSYSREIADFVAVPFCYRYTLLSHVIFMLLTSMNIRAL